MKKPTYNWSQIRDEYITANPEVSQHTLCEKYGCSPRAIAGRCSREQWTAKRAEHMQSVSRELRERAVDLEASYRAEMLRTAQEMTRAGMLSLSRHLARLEADADVALEVEQTRLLLKDASEIVRKALGIPESVDVREYERLTNDERAVRVAALLDRARARRDGPPADGEG
ncbi:MAG TPA: hypothetical protein PLN64_01565 [Candidatus Bipolaricaulis anaerobius]|nr:hypothetical protein [Candidatus Bipolaricaulis anaerobius]